MKTLRHKLANSQVEIIPPASKWYDVFRREDLQSLESPFSLFAPSTMLLASYLGKGVGLSDICFVQAHNFMSVLSFCKVLPFVLILHTHTHTHKRTSSCFFCMVFVLIPSPIAQGKKSLGSRTDFNKTSRAL